MYEVAHQEVDKMLADGIIGRSESAWASCPVIVPKPNGKYRFCVDYRRVNEVTKKDAYPLPHMEAILDKLRSARYISTLDLSQAYFQIALEDDSKEVTAFIVPGKGLFEFNRMPYGLSNAPATFQRLMDRLIGPELEPNVFAYLDDIIIVTSTFEEHLQWLERVVSIIGGAGLEINWDKSHICCSEVRFLGYLVSYDGLSPDPEKIRPILDYPAPTNLKQLRRFLGMVNWYAKFLPDLSRDKIPLNNLVCKNVRWHWGPEQDNAFSKLKQSLCSAPVLARPDFTLPFTIQTDASSYAIGAVLTQVQGGEEHPIVYINRILSATERKYTVTEKECLAVVWAIKKLRPYIEGYSFTVVTDHSSLKWLNNLKDPTGRLARWALALQAYDYTIIHRKGANHHVPDALSRALEDRVFDEGKPIIVESIAIIDEKADSWYQTRIDKILKSPQTFPDWKVEDDRLYCHRPNVTHETIGTDLDAWKLVLPRSMRLDALRRAHEQPSAGHAGADKTYHRLLEKVYWPGMYRDAKKFVKSCSVCQQHKVAQGPPLGLMGSRVAEKPWTVVAADVMGPLPPSRSRCRYIVVFLDNFSKWVEMRALRKANGKTIVKAFEELVIYRWGAPLLLLTDNGTEFINSNVTRFLDEHGVKQVTIPPYHAQANPVERVNRVIKGMISAFVGKNHRDWDLHLHEFQYAINTAKHASTNASPAFVNLGRTLINAHEITRETKGPIKIEKSNLKDWTSRVNRLNTLHNLVRAHLERANKRQARYYNKNRHSLRFRKGDIVWRKNHALSSAAEGIAAKLTPKYIGPYKVLNVISPNVYELDIPDSRSNPKAHVSDLKPFVAPFGDNDEEESSSKEDMKTVPFHRDKPRGKKSLVKTDSTAPKDGCNRDLGVWAGRLRRRAPVSLVN